VPVAPLVAGVDARHVDRDLEIRLLGVLRVELEAATDRAQPAADGAHHHVLHLERH
jgi:hypothetical protein